MTLNDGDVVRINGVSFVKIKNNLVKVTMKDGKPNAMGVTSEQVKHSDGRVDCVVHVPTLSLDGEMKKPS